MARYTFGMPARHLLRRAIPAVLPALLACGSPAGPSSPAPPPPPAAPAALVVASGNLQSAPAGTALVEPVTVLVRDGEGRPLAGQVVTFTITSGGGWTVTAQATTGSDGRAAAEWYVGPMPGAQHLRAALGTGTLTTTASATATPLVPGTTYLGHLGFIEFIAGDGPLVLSAPHGGAMIPPEIPDRTSGTTVTDTNTDPLARAMAAAILAHTGRRPHLVIVRLRRTKLDANREVEEAAQGNPLAIRAWREYHGFIEAAKVAAAGAGPRPFYLDIHGHGHAIPRLELGYLLTAATLDLPDATLDASSSFATASSIRGLAGGATPFSTLLRGASSLGGRFAAEGYPSVPSPAAPSPGNDPYFNGGYSTARHGGRDGGPVNGVQLETHFLGVRDTEPSRQAFAAAAARVLAGFLGM